MTEVLLILCALGLVAACGAFVAAEFAFVTVDRGSVERAAEEGDAQARGVRDALLTLSTQLSAAQLGITLTNLLIGFLAEPAIADLIAGPLASAGVTGAAATTVSLIIALALSTGVTMVFGELVPKNLAIALPLETARAVQGFQRGFTRSTALVVRGLNGLANTILRRLGIEPQEELASARSPEELASLVRRSEQQGTLAADTAALLQRSLSFGDRRAVDVMTPRRLAQTVRADAPVASMLQSAARTGRSRFPVLAEESDDVVGVAHIKQAFGVPYERRNEVRVREVMAAPQLVPASLELDALLEALRRGGLQLAVVVDEWGNVVGLVTLEDLIEEIVGDVRDEHDPRDPPIRRELDGAWLLSGLVRPDEVARVTRVVLPDEDDFETLAGLLTDRLQRIPALGDRVELPARGLEAEDLDVTLTVARMDGLRVDRVRMEAARAEAAGNEHDVRDGGPAG
jgi:CBS domain containing-hemolysin-like protein